MRLFLSVSTRLEKVVEQRQLVPRKPPRLARRERVAVCGRLNLHRVRVALFDSFSREPTAARLAPRRPRPVDAANHARTRRRRRRIDRTRPRAAVPHELERVGFRVGTHAPIRLTIRYSNRRLTIRLIVDPSGIARSHRPRAPTRTSPHRLGRERRGPDEHLVDQHTQRPPVHRESWPTRVMISGAK